MIRSEYGFDESDSISFRLIQVFLAMQNYGEISGHDFVNRQIETNRSNRSDSAVDQMLNAIDQFE